MLQAERLARELPWATGIREAWPYLQALPQGPPPGALKERKGGLGGGMKVQAGNQKAPFPPSLEEGGCHSCRKGVKPQASLSSSGYSLRNNTAVGRLANLSPTGYSEDPLSQGEGQETINDPYHWRSNTFPVGAGSLIDNHLRNPCPLKGDTRSKTEAGPGQQNSLHPLFSPRRLASTENKQKLSVHGGETTA